jgi:hypothetical protein
MSVMKMKEWVILQLKMTKPIALSETRPHESVTREGVR